MSSKPSSQFALTMPREVMAELERLMQEDGPIVQPIWRKFFTVHSKKLKGCEPHPTQYIFFNELGLET